MTQIASTTTDPLSSAPTLPLGRRVLADCPDSLTRVGAIIGMTTGADRDYPAMYEIRIEGHLGGKTVSVPARSVRPVTPGPTPVSGDPYAERAAAEWVARSRGQLDVLDGSYNTGAYHAITEAGRDICRAIDTARAVQRPCCYTWTVPQFARGVENPDPLLYGCAYAAEPGSRACGVHLPIVERTGDFGPGPRGEAIIIEPTGAHDPLYTP